MHRLVSIDCFPTDLSKYQDHAIVAVDVLRASTTAITAVSAGRRCFPVGSLQSAFSRSEQFEDPILVGEVAGDLPPGFDLINSPAQIAALTDLRPLILLSSSGTKLICSLHDHRAAYVACLRNYSAVTSHLAKQGRSVALLGAATRGEFRDEDQLCCAKIASSLQDSGFSSADDRTETIVQRWRAFSFGYIAQSKSADYLHKSGQSIDLQFVLAHIDDISAVYVFREGELLEAGKAMITAEIRV